MKRLSKLVDKKALALMLGIFVLLTMASVLIIVFTMSYRQNEAARERAAVLARDRQALASSTSFGIEDFYRDTSEGDVGAIYPLREPQFSWSKEEVERYWVPPRITGVDDIAVQNDRKIYQSLGVDPPGVEP